jgi:hypothetical protein
LPAFISFNTNSSTGIGQDCLVADIHFIVDPNGIVGASILPFRCSRKIMRYDTQTISQRRRVECGRY